MLGMKKIQRKQEDYPNPWKEKQIFNNASEMSTQLAYEEITKESRNKILNELFNLLTKEESIAWLIDLMQSIRSNPERNKDAKNLWKLNKKDKTSIDPLVYLKVEGFYVKQVILTSVPKQT